MVWARRGTLRVTFEEGTHSTWLYDLLWPHVAEVLVCNPRKNALLKSGNKSDQIDARKLAELLRGGMLSAVYHGQTSTLTVKELGRTYTTLTQDTTRVMSRLKALYRSQAIATEGKKLYTRRRRESWLAQLPQVGQRYRAERMFQQLEALQGLRRQARRDLMVECRKHTATALLTSVPFLGPIRAALLLARVQTPFRFRGKRQFWAYCGLALETRSSADYHFVAGELRRSKKPVLIRGLNLKPQPRSEKHFQSRGYHRQRLARTVSCVLRKPAGEGDEARNGAADLGAQNRRHQLDLVEERRTFRSGTTEITSSLSAQDTANLSQTASVPGPCVLGFEGEYPWAG